MNKDDIYRLIGYHGEYSQNVKKAIRKLLKENHPDNKGDRRIFELISEVKKELELGKVKYKPKNEENIEYDDIDYDYCLKMMNEIKEKKNKETKLLNEKKGLLERKVGEYKDLYHSSLDLENNLLTNSPYFKKVKEIKTYSVITLITMIIIFIIAILKKNNALFFVFLFLSIITVLIIQKYLYLIHKITVNNKKKLNSFIKLNDDIRNNINEQNELKESINDINKKINIMENDLRFYKNLLK